MIRARAIQEAIKAAVEADGFTTQHGLRIFCADQLDVLAQAEQAIADTGIVAIVGTPRLNLAGRDANGMVALDLTQATITISETESYRQDAGTEDRLTSLDFALYIANCVSSLDYTLAGIDGRFDERTRTVLTSVSFSGTLVLQGE